MEVKRQCLPYFIFVDTACFTQEGTEQRNIGPEMDWKLAYLLKK